MGGALGRRRKGGLRWAATWGWEGLLRSPRGLCGTIPSVQTSCLCDLGQVSRSVKSLSFFLGEMGVKPIHPTRTVRNLARDKGRAGITRRGFQPSASKFCKAQAGVLALAV